MMANKKKAQRLDMAIRELQKQAHGLVARFNGRSWGMMRFNVKEIGGLIDTIGTLAEELNAEAEAERNVGNEST